MESPAARRSTSSSPPPAKRSRTAKVAGLSNPNPTDWEFTWGRIASRTTGKKPVHLKDPKGATYTRNGKETSWRCSSKSCPAVVRKLKGDNEYKLHNNHSCKGTNGKTRNHGPTDVPAIPEYIQEHLSDVQEALTEFVNGLDWNVTQHQGTVLLNRRAGVNE